MTRNSNINDMKDGRLSLKLSPQRKDFVGRTLCSAGVCTYTGDAIESHEAHTAEEKIGVMLLNLGGPETLHDVQPFLFNLFADPVRFMSTLFILVFSKFDIIFRFVILFDALLQDIIRLPRLFKFLQRPLAQLISVLRAPKSKEGYAAIGGGSPLRKITNEQVSEA